MKPIARNLLPDTAGVAEDGSLTIGGCDVGALAEEYGTPLFVYDEAHLRARCREAVAAFPGGVSYATKAFLCRAMARLALDEGMSLDVSTGGELHVALAAGATGDRLYLHGNNKSTEELHAARQVGATIVVDSFDEMDRIERLHGGDGKVARVLLRVTPGIEAHTHEFIRTGQNDSKFGFTLDLGLAAQAVERAAASPAMELRGIHVHIGSQVFVAESFDQAIEVLAPLVKDLDLPEFVIGGGLGVPYVDGEEAPTLAQWGRSVREACDRVGLRAKVAAEPGRSIVAAAGVTIYKVGTIKELEGIRTYVSVDGGMSDNPRPVLYGAGYEVFLPTQVLAERTRAVTVVGKHCESGDVLVQDGWVPESIRVGDLLATPVTGAYGYSMGSNYNKVLRPAVVFVADGRARLAVRRETYDDLLATDVG